MGAEEAPARGGVRAMSACVRVRAIRSKGARARAHVALFVEPWEMKSWFSAKAHKRAGGQRAW